ncbi:hypothetical protein NIES4074_02730 [Cylindrospermum sp. NIES-4074]|nr:hypothetical protein NIES4074_02730 [Cylindrospermum sp. NIES-4074]
MMEMVGQQHPRSDGVPARRRRALISKLVKFVYLHKFINPLYPPRITKSEQAP